jgi:hypothetical protein
MLKPVSILEKNPENLGYPNNLNNIHHRGEHYELLLVEIN